MKQSNIINFEKPVIILIKGILCKQYGILIKTDSETGENESYPITEDGVFNDLPYGEEFPIKIGSPGDKLYLNQVCVCEMIKQEAEENVRNILSKLNRYEIDVLLPELLQTPRIYLKYYQKKAGCCIFESNYWDSDIAISVIEDSIEDAISSIKKQLKDYMLYFPQIKDFFISLEIDDGSGKVKENELCELLTRIYEEVIGMTKGVLNIREKYGNEIRFLWQLPAKERNSSI